MKSRVIVILNEQHQLLDEQRQILDFRFGTGKWEILHVPAGGWTLEQVWEVADKLSNFSTTVIFASPVPALMKELAYREGRRDGAEYGDAPFTVKLFHNDRREKKELPDGRQISVVAKEGWQLV